MTYSKTQKNNKNDLKSVPLATVDLCPGCLQGCRKWLGELASLTGRADFSLVRTRLLEGDVQKP